MAGTSREDLNGQAGAVESYDGDKDRFNVALDSGQVIALRASNLQKGGARGGGGGLHPELRKQLSREGKDLFNLASGGGEDDVWANTEVTTQLWDTISRGDLQGLKAILTGNPSAAKVRAEDGRGPLFWANEYVQGRCKRETRERPERDQRETERDKRHTWLWSERCEPRSPAFAPLQY